MPRRSRCSAPASSAPSPPRSARRRSWSGIGRAMRAEDVLLPSYREYGAQFMRGVQPRRAALYWGGDERGSDFAGPAARLPRGACRIAPSACMPRASRYVQAAREPRRRGLCCGDGATSKARFYEAINCAGAWQLPVVFVVNNNQWAISVPRSCRPAPRPWRRRASPAGIPAQVDGNDVIAVLDGVGQALARARAGEGAERDRGADLPPARPHHRRRRQPLPQPRR